MQVLVVGNNHPAVARNGQALQAAGFRTEPRTYAEAGRERLPPNRSPDGAPGGLPYLTTTGQSTYAAVVLDCDVRRCNGSCPLRPFRVNGNRVPVLVLAPAAAAHATCLDAGADAFLAKPYELPVLLASVRALVRRTDGSRCSVLSSRLEVGDLSLDLIKRVATRGSRTVELTRQEFLLLEFLMRHASETCRRKDILHEALGYPQPPGTKVLAVSINRLRVKIDDGFETQLIHTVQGIGYKLTTEP